MTKGTVLIKEGCCNQEIYLVKSGDFQVSQQYKEVNKVNQLKEKVQVRSFLDGGSANRSTRSVFSRKITQVTKRENLTNLQNKNVEVELSIFGKGALFGEERLVLINQ